MQLAIPFSRSHTIRRLYICPHFTRCTHFCSGEARHLPFSMAHRRHLAALAVGLTLIAWTPTPAQSAKCTRPAYIPLARPLNRCCHASPTSRTPFRHARGCRRIARFQCPSALHHAQSLLGHVLFQRCHTCCAFSVQCHEVFQVHSVTTECSAPVAGLPQWNTEYDDVVMEAADGTDMGRHAEQDHTTSQWASAARSAMPMRIVLELCFKLARTLLCFPYAHCFTA